MEKIIYLTGKIVFYAGGLAISLLLIAALIYLVLAAWVCTSNRFRDVCKAESLIFEYRKNREIFLEWKEENEKGT